MAEKSNPKHRQLELTFDELEGPGAPNSASLENASAPNAISSEDAPKGSSSTAPTEAQQPHADPQHISHALKVIVSRIPRPKDETRSLFDEAELPKAQPKVEAPTAEEPPKTEKAKVPDLKHDRVIPVLTPAGEGSFQEGGALCQSYPMNNRAEQTTAYIKRNQILLNKKGGLRKLDPAEQTQALSELRTLFSHFPYQTLDFLFRQFPKHTYQNHKQTASQPQLRAAACQWIEDFPHTQQEVRAWIGVVNKQLGIARANAVPGRRLRVGKNAVSAASALHSRYQQISRSQSADSDDGNTLF
jgi:hypothetical protein